MLLKRIIAWTATLSRIMNYFSMVLIFLIALLMFIDILLRFVTKQSILGTYEMTEMGMVIVIFGALANTQVLKGHVRVTMLMEQFPKGVQTAFEGILLLITTVVSGFVCYASFVQAGQYYTDKATTGVLRISYYPFAYFMAIGMLVFTIVLLLDALTTFAPSYDNNALSELV